MKKIQIIIIVSALALTSLLIWIWIPAPSAPSVKTASSNSNEANSIEKRLIPLPDRFLIEPGVGIIEKPAESSDEKKSEPPKIQKQKPDPIPEKIDEPENDQPDLSDSETISVTPEISDSTQEENIHLEAETYQQTETENVALPVKSIAPEISPQIDRDGIISQYRAKLFEIISRNKSYPPVAKRLGQEGEIQISFTVLSGGTIQNLKVLKSSGFSSLDNGALDSVNRSLPLPPIPSELEMDSLNISVTLKFTLK